MMKQKRKKDAINLLTADKQTQAVNHWFACIIGQNLDMVFNCEKWPYLPRRGEMT